MVKKFIAKEIEDSDNDEFGEDDDLEIECNEEEMSFEYPNDEEKMNELTLKIRREFANQFTSKGKNPNWLEKMDLIGDQKIPDEFNIDDDIRRELIFYNISHKNTIQGILKLKECNEKLNRPGDFFAEMIKSDYQMVKIRKKVVNEQQRIKKFEEKKQKLQNVKFAKAMKDSQARTKADYKKKTREGIEKYKKSIYFICFFYFT
jgi:rRNA-processing protein EBP2